MPTIAVAVLDDVAGGMVPIGECTHVITPGSKWLNVSKRTAALLRLAGMGESLDLTPGVQAIFDMATTKPLADLQADEAFLAAKLRGLQRAVESGKNLVSEAEARLASSAKTEEDWDCRVALSKARDQLAADQFECEYVHRRHQQTAQVLAVALAFNAN